MPRTHERDGRSRKGAGLYASATANRMRKLNGPPEGSSWVWFTAEMLESPAWRALTGNALKLIMRIALEHMKHGGKDNGKLPVTYSDFVAYGVRRNAVNEALEIASQLGFVRRREGGMVPWAGGIRATSKYELTSMSVGGAPPRNDWTRVGTDADARTTVRRAKKACEMMRTGSRKRREKRKPKNRVPIGFVTWPSNDSGTPPNNESDT
jgi:hypothetical protein